MATCPWSRARRRSAEKLLSVGAVLPTVVLLIDSMIVLLCERAELTVWARVSTTAGITQRRQSPSAQPSATSRSSRRRIFPSGFRQVVGPEDRLGPSDLPA